MRHVSVTAKPRASQRTKNRIREHRTLFELVDGPRHCDALKAEGILLRSAGGWFGWLPTSDVEFTEVNGLTGFTVVATFESRQIQSKQPELDEAFQRMDDFFDDGATKVVIVNDYDGQTIDEVERKSIHNG